MSFISFTSPIFEILLTALHAQLPQSSPPPLPVTTSTNLNSETSSIFSPYESDLWRNCPDAQWTTLEQSPCGKIRDQQTRKSPNPLCRRFKLPQISLGGSLRHHDRVLAEINRMIRMAPRSLILGSRSPRGQIRAMATRHFGPIPLEKAKGLHQPISGSGCQI